MSVMKTPEEPARPARKPARAPARKARKTHRPAREAVSSITRRLYASWSAIVRGRAGNRCEVCGAEGVLDAHHIQPRQICPELRFSPDNGVCLCKSHHKFGVRSAHKGMLWFVDWLWANHHDRYRLAMSWALQDLPSPAFEWDRDKLYAEEAAMHLSWECLVGPLPEFEVRYVGRDGTEASTVVRAANRKAAEYLASRGCADFSALSPDDPKYRPAMKAVISARRIHD